MYLIVEFIHEGSTGPVAKSWYSEGHSWWPPYKEIDRVLKSVRLMEAPQPDKGWTKHQARILHESASFDKISKKWKQACYTSDISESEMPAKRIPKKKIYTSDDEPCDTPHKKKKLNKEKSLPTPRVPPAPKAPTPPRHIRAKGPLVRPQLTSCKTINSFCNSFVRDQQKATEKQQQACFETPSTSQVSAPDVPVRFCQEVEHQDTWDKPQPENQEDTFSVLRPLQDRAPHNTYSVQDPKPSADQRKMQTPVFPISMSHVNEQEDAWGDHPSSYREDTTSELRPSSTQARAKNASGISRWSCISSQCTPVERAILEKLNELDMKITHLTSVVQSLAPRSSGQMVVDTEDDTFPIETMEDLEQLEWQLAEKPMMEKMMKRLSIRGGQTLKKTIWRVASKVFGPVAKQLNWCGRGDKRGLKNTNIGTLVIGAAMRNPVLPSPTEAEAEKYLKDFLRLAPGRMAS
ncbi:uncharacterized protein isoform X2 [Danio rerio]